MKVILETLRAHYILYLRFYLNNRCILCSFGGSSGFGFKVKGGFSGDSGSAAGGGINSGSNIGINIGSGSASGLENK
jgi:hypothetical protein